MKVIDIIRDNREILALLARYDIPASDVDYLCVIEEYESMKQRGYKITFAVEYLAQKYGLSVAKFYRILKRLNAKIII